MNNKTKNIIGWIITGLLVLAFLMAGGVKLSGQEEMVQNFDKWGYPIVFMYVIGLFEILGAIGLLVKNFRIFSAIGLILLMLGAIGTHLINGEAFFAPLILLLLLVLLAAILKNTLYQKVRSNDK